MLVERDRNGLLSNPGGFKKSATENSQLNKKAVKNVGRYSGSFSPPGDGDVCAIYDMTTVKEMVINDIQVKNSTPTRGEGKNKPLDNEILSGLRGCVINEKREQRTIRGRDSLFTPQLNRREPVQRFESPMLGGKRYPLGHFQNTQSFQNNFSSPKSERGFVIRREKSNFSSPARSDKNQGRSPRTPQLSQCTRKQEWQTQMARRSCEISPEQSPYKLFPSGQTSKSERIYAQPVHPGIGKRSLTQIEISRPQVNDHLHYAQCLPKVNNPPNEQPKETFTHGDKIVKKGLMWVQQDKLFSRWKERFIILTPDYIQFFKKGNSRISEMGTFIFKIRLSEIFSCTLEDRRGYLTVAVTSKKEGKMLLRKTEGIRDWQKILAEKVHISKDRQERKQTTTDQFWTRKQKSDSHDIQTWLLARDRIGQQFSYMTPPPTYKLTQRFSPCDPNRTPTPVQYIPSIPISYFSPTSPTPLQNTEEDSGFESLVTNVSDSGSLSSRLVAISPAQRDLPNVYLPKFSDPPYQNCSKMFQLEKASTPLPSRQLANQVSNVLRNFN